MAEAIKNEASYRDLYAIPENMTGEIIDGELIVTPRPSRVHVYAAFSLAAKLIPPHQFGEGDGPGGWIILVEPEIGLEKEVVVPDLAGWRRERFPQAEDHNWISVAPDWVCEILSPGTARNDRVKKMRLFARHDVPYTWLTDPLLMTLEVFKLESGRWLLLNIFSENDKVRAEPFPQVELDLSNLWLQTGQ